jgi:hypothetical protein
MLTGFKARGADRPSRLVALRRERPGSQGVRACVCVRVRACVCACKRFNTAGARRDAQPVCTAAALAGMCVRVSVCVCVCVCGVRESVFVSESADGPSGRSALTRAVGRAQWRPRHCARGDKRHTPGLLTQHSHMRA